jgi:hypothetical protein
MTSNALITTYAPAQRQIVAHLGEDAQTHNVGDIERLSRGIRRWANDRESLSRARRNTWAIAESTCNCDMIDKKKLVNFVDANLVS